MVDPRALQLPVGALLNQAVALHQMRRFAEAERIYDSILKTDPNNADALNLKGVAALDKGHAAESLILLDRAAALIPNFPPVHFNKGNALSALGRVDDALDAYAHAIALKSDFADARVNAGLLLEKNGRLEDAIVAFRAMCRHSPADARGFFNLGVCLEKLLARKNVKTKVVVPEAFAAFEQALKLAPNDAATHCALGTLCSRLGDYRRALVHTERAVLLKPDWADAWVNLGGHKEALGDRTGALAAFDHALSLAPENAGADVNRGLTLLALGRLAEGWRGYRRRFEDPRFPFIPRDWPWRVWQGESLKDRSILLWGDQGIGDEILYAGMIPEVAKRAGRCVVECSARLEPLFRRSFSGIEIVARSQTSATDLEKTDFDFHSSILDVGQWLRPSLTAFPNRSHALLGDAARARRLRDLYLQERPATAALIGLSWRSVNPRFGAQKSVSLLDFAPLLEKPRLTFINAQYGDVEQEQAAAEQAHGISILRDPDIDPLRDLDGLAAQLLALDMLVTVSNSTAHLAAALGVPTLIYVPEGHKRLWYWLDHGAYSPWYRSASIIRGPLKDALGSLSGYWDAVGSPPGTEGARY
jgi:tetratricopeptide (TPR) repeat protein